MTKTKHQLDYEFLARSLNAAKEQAKLPVIKMSEVDQSRMTKVGFGVIRYTDPRYTKTNLWKIEGDHIVAMYENEDEIEKESMNKQASISSENTKLAWSIVSDKSNKTATFFYNNTPITSIGFQEFNITSASEVELFKSIMPQRLANNKELVKLMLNSIDDGYRAQILNQHPELNK